MYNQPDFYNYCLALLNPVSFIECYISGQGLGCVEYPDVMLSLHLLVFCHSATQIYSV